MRVAVSEAKAQLTDLVRRAQAGEEVILTRHGQPAVRLVPERRPRLRGEELKQLFDDVQKAAKSTALPGPCAARSQDFLYDDETGLPI